MAHDGFLGTFHGVAWPYAHGAAPFDAALQVQHALMGAGWEHESGTLALGSALSSLVSSPVTAGERGGGGFHSQGAVLVDELVSRLGVCGGLAIPSPPSSSQHASCYSTPVGSPSKPAALSCFPPTAGGTCGRKLSRVASSQSLLAGPAPGTVHLAARDGPGSDGHCRKRKAPGAKAKGKDAVAAAITMFAQSPEPETRAKKCKLSPDATGDEQEPIMPPAAGEAAGHGGNGKGKEPAEDPHKDYIHVRARRGQATDSHSLAERVRREKISERMKLLQDLVPSCNKVTGKAVMLDEIINYVQSLQRQVEFLSMKLATVNPRLELENVDNFLPNDVNEASVPAPSPLSPPPPAYSLEGSSPAFCYAPSQDTAMQSVATSAKGFEVPSSFVNPAMQSVATSAKGFEVPSSFVNHGIQGSSHHGFQNANSQIGSMWEDDLQSVVQMGFRGNNT